MTYRHRTLTRIERAVLELAGQQSQHERSSPMTDDNTPTTPTLGIDERIMRTPDGFRIPHIEFTLLEGGPVPDTIVPFLEVTAWPNGWQLDTNGTAQSIPLALIPTLLDELRHFATHAPEAAALPAPAMHPEVVKPRRKRPSRAKTAGGRGGHDPKPPIPLPDPSHYPPEVRDAPRPPEVPGGYPKGLGMWERLADPNHPQDEYGNKRGLEPVDDRVEGPGA